MFGGVFMFYDNFKTLCDKKGISVSKAAEEIGFNKATVTWWKRQGLTPRTENLYKIADYFGVTPEYLLTGSESVAQQKPNYAPITVFNYKGTPGARKIEINDDNFEAIGDLITEIENLPAEKIRAITEMIKKIK